MGNAKTGSENIKIDNLYFADITVTIYAYSSKGFEAETNYKDIQFWSTRSEMTSEERINSALGEHQKTVAYSHPVEISKRVSGCIDASSLREYRESNTSLLDLSNYIFSIAPEALHEVKLPFNCKFGTRDAPGMDLSNVDKVSFTKLTISLYDIPEIVDNKIVKKDDEKRTYGDYVNDANLGVIVNSEKCGIIDENVSTVAFDFTLGSFASSATYNKPGLTLVTDYLYDDEHVIAEDTTYNFGFSGTKILSIINDEGADCRTIFKGDASGYAPTGDITLTNKTVYAGNNSFIKKSYQYGELEFAAAAEGSALANKIPNGVEVSATKFSVGKGHTVTIKGKLRA